MVRRVGGPHFHHSALPILAPYLAPIRTHLTRVTRVSRCTPHGTVAHAQLSSWQAKCARSAGRLLIILDTLSCGLRMGSRRAAADGVGVRLGARRCRAAKLSMSDPQALGFPRWPGPMEMSGAGVGYLGRVGVVCCGTVWFCQVGARTCLRSHQARPEERLLPLNVHFNRRS